MADSSRGRNVIRSPGTARRWSMDDAILTQPSGIPLPPVLHRYELPTSPENVTKRRIASQPGTSNLDRSPIKTPPRPVLTQAPQDYFTGADNAASGVYGTTVDSEGKDRPIYGPINYVDLGLDTWSQVGQEYRQVVPHTSPTPFFPQQMAHLAQHGIYFQVKIGEGGQGEVWRCWTTQVVKGKGGTKMNAILACKILALETFSACGFGTVRQTVDDLLYESNLHSTLSHDFANIVKFHDIFNIYDSQSGFSHAIFVLHFMELCDGDLKGLITTRQTLTEDESREWFCQIVCALEYLHDNNIAHLDIKPHNVLYVRNPPNNTQYLFKLTDFGLSQRFSIGGLTISSKRVGTRRYQAPEVQVLRGSPYDAKCADIYSLGITLAVSLSGFGYGVQHPEQELLSDAKHWSNLVQQKWHIDSITCDLLTQMTAMEAKARPLIYQVKRHEFLSQRPYEKGQWSKDLFV